MRLRWGQLLVNLYINPKLIFIFLLAIQRRLKPPSPAMEAKQKVWSYPSGRFLYQEIFSPLICLGFGVWVTMGSNCLFCLYIDSDYIVTLESNVWLILNSVVNIHDRALIQIITKNWCFLVLKCSIYLIFEILRLPDFLLGDDKAKVQLLYEGHLV